MKNAPIPANEEARLCAVFGLKVLDTPTEERFDRLTRRATELFHVPVSTISILDKDREWYKSRQGIKQSEGPRATSFCGHALLQEEILIIEDTAADPRFADNPYVVHDPHVRFYAGKSLHKAGTGEAVGVFCIKDFQPRRMTLEEISAFLDLAAQAEAELNR